MARAKQNINPTTILIIGGAIVLWPVIKGLFSAVGIVGDIVQAPGKIIDALNNSQDQAILDILYRKFITTAKNTVYDPNNSNDRKLMEILLHSPFAERDQIAEEWKRPKGINFLQQGTLKAALANSLNKLLKGFF